MTSDRAAGRPGAGGPTPAGDGDAAVQQELRREVAERDAIGSDTPTDRNLSGSSTWVTLGGAGGGAAAGEPGAIDGPRRPAAP